MTKTKSLTYEEAVEAFLADARENIECLFTPVADSDLPMPSRDQSAREGDAWVLFDADGDCLAEVTDSKEVTVLLGYKNSKGELVIIGRIE
jgi:hypothetical protein